MRELVELAAALRTDTLLPNARPRACTYAVYVSTSGELLANT
jgi:hypothetical protein